MGAALPAEEHRASLLALCRVLLELREYPEAFLQARLLLGQSIEQGDPDAAAAACLAMYESGQEESISALGHAVWLVVACPVNPEQVLQAMRSLVEETPENSDGAAVAAMLGYFLVEKRSLGGNRERHVFLARQLVAEVAKRHRGITDEETIGVWVQMYDLDDVDLLLERLKRILAAIIPQWWFDREDFLQRLEQDA